MDAATDGLVGEQAEEALDLVDPGGRGGREVDMPPGPLCKPVADQLGLVGGDVVHDEVDVEVRRNVGLDDVEEPSELAGVCCQTKVDMSPPARSWPKPKLGLSND